MAISRQTALTNIQSLSTANLKTIANAALLAAIEANQEGINAGMNAAALAAAIRSLVGGGDDITG